MALKIITDSACDLPKSVTEEYGIEVIPTPVLIEETDYFDGETIHPKEFYEILREGKKISTYHINAFMFREAFEKYAKEKDDLIYICFSTGIAGTFNAANQAKSELLEDYPDFDLTIIDSKCASIGFGLVVLYTAMLYKRGLGKEELIRSIQYHIEHMNHVFTVDTLEYLLKGGRISKSSAVMGSMLNIKPIIIVNEAGELKSVEKIRGRKRSIQRIVDYVGEHSKNPDKQMIGLVHGDDAETADMVKKMLHDRYGVTQVIDNNVGCAIGAHTGPGIIGITFLDEVSKYMK